MEALRGVTMNPNAFRVLTMLWTYASADGTNAHPGNERLAKDCAMAERTVERWLKWLRESGWIVLAEPGNGRGRAANYSLDRQKVDSQVSPFMGEKVDSSRAKGRQLRSQKVDSQVSPHQCNTTRYYTTEQSPRLRALRAALESGEARGLEEYGYVFTAPPLPPDVNDVQTVRALIGNARRDAINEWIATEENKQ
jgi:biotin operon repressor